MLNIIPLCMYPLGIFHLLTIMNNAAMNMGVQISITDAVLTSFVYIPKSGITAGCEVVSYYGFFFFFF